MKKKDNIMHGLTGLLSTMKEQENQQEPLATQEPVKEQPPFREQKNKKGTTVRVCYNLNKDVIEKIKAIARYDRKNINEVITEALQAYISNWVPTDETAPKF